MKYKVGDTIRTLVHASGTEKGESPIGSIGMIVSVQESYGYQELLVNSESFPDYADNEWYFEDYEVELVQEPIENANAEPTETVQQGVKFDSEKEEYSLLPKRVLKPVMRVLSFGAKKYAKDNWQKVPNAKERYFNALHRHLDAWWCGEKYDKETGENHLAHAACCLLFLLWFEEQEGVKDD